MLRDEPNADNILLIFLCGAVGMLACFGYLMYWLMQPTVLPGAEVAAIARRPPVGAPRSKDLQPPAFENERLAVAFAEAENDRQSCKHWHRTLL